ncbi:MAG TPA: hypothetical protein VGW75_14635 [Solirubrobacteraceae bacterium]|nr:hypothetical protein [Solirubrobacteraceae bacterium]
MRVLLVVESIVSDGDVDLRDEYRAQEYEAWVDGEIEPVAGLTGGRLHEPPGVGLALLLAAPYAVAGPVAAELLVAALLALGFVAAAGLARRLVPDPWATGGVLVAGLSAPALAWSTAIASEPVAAAAVAGAALYTLRVRDEPTFRRATTAALLIALLPWLSVKYVPVAAVCALALARWLRRRRRGLTAFAALEVVLVPAVLLISVNERLYGGLTPYAAVPGDATGASSAADYAGRAERLVTLFADPDWGILAWAPFAALALFALELLARSLRERLSVALPGVVDVEVTAGFLVALCAAQLAVAAFLSPVFEDPGGFPGRELLPAIPAASALAAWGLRHAPRIGAALGALTLAASAWLLVGARAGDGELAPPSGPLPWAGAEPAVAAAAGAALAFLLVRGLRRE